MTNENLVRLIVHKISEYLQTKMLVIDNEYRSVTVHKLHLNQEIRILEFFIKN